MVCKPYTQRDMVMPQSAVRRCLKGFMEITESDELPQPLDNGSCWEAYVMSDVKTGEEVPSRRLRPAWDKPWADNESAWLLDVIHRMRTSGAEYTEHDFSSVTHIQFSKAIDSVWKTFIKKWAAQKKTKATRETRALLSKYNQRKAVVSLSLHDIGVATHPWLLGVQKSKTRQVFIRKGLVPELQEPRNKHLSEWHYASTEYL